MRGASVVLLVGLISCGNEQSLSKDPQCDGEQQQGEDTVDSPFDRDGDGFFDGANPNCAAVYSEEQLDCNDADDKVNPSRTEKACNGKDDDCDDDTEDEVDEDDDGVTECDDCDDKDDTVSPDELEQCGDDIDNDCDDEVDEECVYNYSGTWDVSPPLIYNCAGGAVNLNFTQFLIVDQNPLFQMISVGSNQPGTMSGSISNDVDFFATRTINGSCDELYQVSGSFTGEDTFEGIFSVAFSGGFCFNCTQQIVNITGERQ